MELNIEGVSAAEEAARPMGRLLARTVSQDELDKLSLQNSKEANFLTITIYERGLN
ncbi:hypothetical protein [Dyella nitratireducens]|uniref:Uncharacterized protein n=1 Tax=Dyella nitratireducens TaxID=1849580 RepID=A0ABQ1G648_9GAMM|nr:hypothetical protein [Dyella nitratireducens]GGA37506.1 hypothetical protein GCM10010981_28310 [Dyella nitratireducens]GLQ41209.1 hypothetical protein GCM10007902_10590 [Dyella nitratireducens]